MSKDNNLKPVGADERIHVLDSLRGFAIFGILIINIRVFSGYTFMSAETRSTLLSADLNSLFDWIHIVFFSGKFYTMFSLLFGIGFAIQLMRSSKTSRSFYKHFSRRLFFLLLFGIAHIWAIWFGDILLIYALCGYVLILFMNLPNRVLIFLAFVLLLIPGLHAWYLNTVDYSYTDYFYRLLTDSWKSQGLPNVQDEYQTFRMIDVVKVIQSDSWSTLFSFNYIGPLLRGYLILQDARLFKVLAIFILGFWTGRQLLQHKLHENRSCLIKYAIIGFLIGLPINLYNASGQILFFSGKWGIVFKEGISPFGYVFLTTGYIALFMLLHQTRFFNKLLKSLLSPVGKTALSNYILQSILGILLFYEVGLGLGDYLGTAYLTLAVVLIFIFQIILSAVWLRRYKYGPLEWLWRVLTYGKHLNNKR